MSKGYTVPVGWDGKMWWSWSGSGVTGEIKEGA